MTVSTVTDGSAVESAVSHQVSVSFLMGSKIAALGKPLVAVSISANVRLLSSMCSVVSSQVKIQREFLVSNVSSKWFFSRVN